QMDTDKHRLKTGNLSVFIRVHPWLNSISSQLPSKRYPVGHRNSEQKFSDVRFLAVAVRKHSLDTERFS
ncbi:MAG: hypothetical protein KJZ78_28100, partial [Bryobacteraceae bacterium]|nr:hypothetical protein [Bryobacteraceae bacterium]